MLSLMDAAGGHMMDMGWFGGLWVFFWIILLLLIILIVIRLIGPSHSDKREIEDLKFEIRRLREEVERLRREKD